ncbi:MAG: RES family NAD+ phosphorylase [Vulcanimicrobiaceae bacterium]
MAKIQPVPLAGYATRFLPERYANYELSSIGAHREGGRYNPPGIAVLYTSLQRMTALAEVTELYTDEDPLSPHTMYTVEFNLTRVFDLTDATVLERLQTTTDELCAPVHVRSRGNAPTQVLGSVLVELGLEALRAPSRCRDEGTNLVIFTDNAQPPAYALYRDVAERPAPLDVPASSNVVPFPPQRNRNV